MLARSVILVSMASLVASSLAHENDPKGKGLEPAYEGPGWREGQGGLAGGYDSSKMLLRSWMTISELHNSSSSCNDCTGYVSPSGREYAIIGTNRGTAFVEITDPGNPQLIQYRSGSSSTWRDMKVFGEYAYVVSEGGGGIQCFDLTNIDNGSVPQPQSVTTGGAQTTHNVAVNTDSGYLYRCGGGSNHGLRIYDLNADPLNPPFVGEWMDRYVHDLQVVSYLDGPYAGMEVAFCCAGYNNGSTDTALDIVDVTDKQNPTLMRSLQYPGGAYSHQGWLTPDRKYFLLGDELDEGNYVDYSSLIVIKVENPYAPLYKGTWDNGNSAITHNIYTRGDFAFMANYTSGIRVFDIRDPEAMKEVGYFDTYPDSDVASFNGLWGCYADYPSGTVIGSDIQRGLFVFTPDLADISFFPTGESPRIIASAGQVIEFHVDVLATEIDNSSAFVSFNDGSGIQQVPAQHLGGVEFRAVLPTLTCPGTLTYSFGALDTAGTLFEGPSIIGIIADDFPSTFTDDFEDGTGWVVEGSAETVADGRWMRGWPVGDGTWGDPTEDYDGSGRCYLTGNGPGLLEVNGEAILISPVMEASSGVAFVSYARWFNNAAGPWPMQDSMYVEITSDGSNWVQLEQIGPDTDESSGGWYMRTFRVDEYVEANDSVQLRFRAVDESPNSVVEAAVDAVAMEVVICNDGLFGDLNGDGSINGGDLAILLGDWGESDSIADLNEDFLVDGADLAIILGLWTD